MDNNVFYHHASIHDISNGSALTLKNKHYIADYSKFQKKLVESDEVFWKFLISEYNKRLQLNQTQFEIDRVFKFAVEGMFEYVRDNEFKEEFSRQKCLYSYTGLSTAITYGNKISKSYKSTAYVYRIKTEGTVKMYEEDKYDKCYNEIFFAFQETIFTDAKKHLDRAKTYIREYFGQSYGNNAKLECLVLPNTTKVVSKKKTIKLKKPKLNKKDRSY